MVWKIVRTFAPAFENNGSLRANKERVLWKTYINREVVQEASYIIKYSVIRVKDTNRQFEKIESLLWASIIRESSKSTEQTSATVAWSFASRPGENDIFTMESLILAQDER